MHIRTPLLVLSLLLATSSAFAKEPFATVKEAEAMVGKAVVALKVNKQKTLDEITAKDPKWTDRDLYVMVYNMSGTVLAHGANPKMVGKDMIDFKDVDGKLFIKERMELAKSKTKFSQDYKFTDPVTKKVLPKIAYCETVDGMVACAGVYKR